MIYEMKMVCGLALVMVFVTAVYSQPGVTEIEEPYVPGKNVLVENNGRLTGKEKQRIQNEKLEKQKHKKKEGLPTIESEQKILDLQAKYERFLKRCVRDGELPTITKKLQQFFNDTHLTIEDVEAECERRRQASGSRQKRTYIASGAGVWDLCIIPYKKDTSLPDSWATNIDGTHAYYEQYTGFRFVEYTGDNSVHGLSHDNYLNYINGGGCWSYVGNLRGNGQSISPCSGRGTQVHEIGHALGLNHEQKHPVSFDYLQVLYKNIQPNYRSQYYRAGFDDVHNQDRFYDISSTMHYANWGFSQNYGATLRANDPELEYLIGNDNDFYLFRDLQPYHSCFDYFPNCNPLPVCENGGYPTVFEGSCSCRCPEGLDPDTNCGTTLTPTFPTQWPEGTFTVLKTTLGDCPAGFSDGRMSYTNPDWAWQGGDYHSPGYIDGYSWHHDVCTQTSSSSAYDWPKGQYCIMRYGGSCPTGFAEGLMEAYGDTPPSGNTGTLPDGTHNSLQQYMMCCRSDGTYSQKISLPVSSPFILYRQNYYGCQEVEGMVVTGEYYHLKGNTDSNPQFTGSLPYHYRWNDGMFNTYFCVYQPVAQADCSAVIEFTDKDGQYYEITSPNYPSNYPANVECMWHFKSPAGTTMLIDFMDFDVSCNGFVALKTYYPGMPEFSFCGSDYLKSHFTLENSLTVKLNGGDAAKGFKANVTLLRDHDKCYNGDGKDQSYSSTLNYTQSFSPCLQWSEVQDCLYGQFDARSIDFDLNNNYCRNVGTGQMPWCYINSEMCIRENCDPCMAGRCFDQYSDCSQRVADDADFCSRNDFGEAHRMCMSTCGRCTSHQLMSSKSVVRCGEPGDVTCISPEPVKNDYEIGDVVTYACPYSNDYRTRTCTSNGTWTPLNTVCNDPDETAPAGAVSSGPSLFTACPTGWSVFDKRCFKWLGWDQVMSHSDAKAACESLGGRLPKANTSEVNSFLSELTDIDVDDLDYVWLGMTDEGTNNVWTWDDGEPVTYESWSGQPSSNAGDCAAGWGDWYVSSCTYGYQYQVVCEYEYSGTPVCNDNLPNCMEILEATPDICSTQSDYAWHQCRHTCAVGDCDFPVTCDDEGVTGSGTRVNGASTISQGEFIGYECDVGYFHTSGNLKRACLPSGQLTGSKPVCSLPAATERVELFTNTQLFYRAYTTSNRLQLSPSAQGAVIPYDGYISEWIFYSNYKSDLAFQVWRKTNDETQYTLVGQNIISDTTDDGAIVVARIPNEARIEAKAGDLIGFISAGSVGYTRCDGNIQPEHSPWYISSSTYSDYTSFTVGSDYSFLASSHDCKIYSVRVTLSPCNCD